MPKLRRGITLIEALVVIAIICVMIAIIYPIFRASNTAKQSYNRADDILAAKSFDDIQGFQYEGLFGKRIIGHLKKSIQVVEIGEGSDRYLCNHKNTKLFVITLDGMYRGEIHSIEIYDPEAEENKLKHRILNGTLTFIDPDTNKTKDISFLEALQIWEEVQAEKEPQKPKRGDV